MNTYITLMGYSLDIYLPFYRCAVEVNGLGICVSIGLHVYMYNYMFTFNFDALLARCLFATLSLCR